MIEFKIYKLGELIDVQNGYAFKSDDLKTIGIPIIKIKNIQPPNISIEDADRYPHEISERLKQFVVKKKDILISMTGSHVSQISSAVGKVGRYRFDKPSLLNQRVGKLYSKDENVLNNDFLYYYIARPEIQFELATNAGGSANQANISPQDIKELDIEIPDLPTQTHIAAILSALDDKIELNRRTNETLEKIAETLFKKFFVEGINEENLPEGWRMGKLGEMYKTTSGGTPSRTNIEYYENGTICWIKSKELEGTFILNTEEKITDNALKKSSAKLLPVNSVLVAMYGATVGELAVTSIEATCNQAICAILPNDTYPYSYIYQFLRLNKEELINMATGSAQQNISQLTIQNFELVIPPIGLINDYHKVVNDILKQIECNLKANNSLTKIRDSLLPKLMLGKIEVNERIQIDN